MDRSTDPTTSPALSSGIPATQTSLYSASSTVMVELSDARISLSARGEPAKSDQHILSILDNDILQPIRDEQESLRVDSTDITSSEPSVRREGFVRRFLVVPISGGDVGTSYDNLSYATERKGFASVDVDNLATSERRNDSTRRRFCDFKSAVNSSQSVE